MSEHLKDMIVKNSNAKRDWFLSVAKSALWRELMNPPIAEVCDVDMSGALLASLRQVSYHANGR